METRVKEFLVIITNHKEGYNNCVSNHFDINIILNETNVCIVITNIQNCE